MVPDKFEPNPDLDVPDELGPSYMEYGLIKLFTIDLMRLVELKATLAKNFHIQPSEIDALPFWEYELFMKFLNNQVQEENDRQKAEMAKYDIDGTMRAANPKNMQKSMSSMTPKMPNFGSIKAPSFKF